MPECITLFLTHYGTTRDGGKHISVQIRNVKAPKKNKKNPINRTTSVALMKSTIKETNNLTGALKARLSVNNDPRWRSDDIR